MFEGKRITDLEVSNVWSMNSEIELNIAIDPGSTETRSIIWDSNRFDATLPDEDVESSIYYKGSFDEDYSDIKIMDAMLSDSLEFRLSTIAEKKFSFLKGSLAKQYGDSSSVSSAISKANQDATIVNIHSAICMGLLNKIMKDKEDIPDRNVVRIKLTIALPPEDTDKGRVAIIKDSLDGVYSVEMPRIGKTLSYSINKNEIVIISECNAAATYYAIVEDDGSLSDNEENAVLFEGGGRSSSIAIIKEGTLISKMNFNSNDVSGKKLREKLSQIISDSKGINRLSDSNAERALTTGVYRHGKENVPVAEELIEAKKQFAKDCVKVVLTALDGAGMAATDIQKIIFSGRLFKTVCNTDLSIIVPSLADFVAEEFNAQTKAHADYRVIQREYPIPQGLAIYRMGIEL